MPYTVTYDNNILLETPPGVYASTSLRSGDMSLELRIFVILDSVWVTLATAYTWNRTRLTPFPLGGRVVVLSTAKGCAPSGVLRPQAKFKKI